MVKDPSREVGTDQTRLSMAVFVNHFDFRGSKIGHVQPDEDEG